VWECCTCITKCLSSMLRGGVATRATRGVRQRGYQWCWLGRLSARGKAMLRGEWGKVCWAGVGGGCGGGGVVRGGGGKGGGEGKVSVFR